MEMDTPERSKVGGASLSNKFEDSPVFSFINSLSPIQPVKSTYATSSVQAYQPLSFSIFTSPHANPQKAPRPQLRDDISEAAATDTGSNNGCSENSAQPNAQTALTVFEPTKINSESSTQCLLNEADKCTDFDAGSPDHNTTCRTFKTNFRPETNEGPSQRKNLFAAESATSLECKDEVIDNDWDYLLAGNPDDLLICDPSTEGEEGSDTLVDGGADTCQFLINNTQPSGVESHLHLGTTNESPDVLVSGTALNGKILEKVQGGDLSSIVHKEESQQQRGMRRRCLVFDPSVSVTSRVKMISDGPKPRKAPAMPTLPGIGLHLNSLTAVSTVSKDLLNVGNMSVHKSQTKVLVACNSLECPTGTSEETSLMVEESSLAIVPIDAVEPHNSPKKRRRKADSSDGDACKRCSCKKSKCLKLYCECFAAGVYCSEPCACQGCFNKPIHEETVLSTRKQIEFRNPLAFAPKVIRTSDPGLELGEDSNNTPASARHKRGCNCKKSNCLKKYCECFQGGVGCSASCRCESCKNTFGRREEFVHEGEGGNVCDKEEEDLEDSQEKAGVKNFDPHAVDLIPITPPFETCGTLVKLPCYSSAKPPKPTYTLPTVISSGLYTSRHLINLKDLTTPTSCGENEDTPDRYLINNDSPHGGVTKTSSPNGKRVSPPHSSTGASPNRKGGRKLILKSIPSFPSLAGDGFNDCFANNHKSSSFSATSITRGP
ncbi:Protein tesmin/TSO1-like CXC 2 [Rhynchospora pubera]|uniref:Protein tesmin/TSO1-like CXC 2 n=1 Tax=Rhynchospora pubera TaxID=906938 RepID=A0AAV8BPR0_9POAL|nr:Protein tesmin/TSO1-like CXC 2 [Rhynchospora pubera]